MIGSASKNLSACLTVSVLNDRDERWEACLLYNYWKELDDHMGTCPELVAHPIGMIFSSFEEPDPAFTAIQILLITTDHIIKF